MELYTLDPLLRRTEVIDKFESLIWTERYQAYGDFELTLYSDVEARRILTTGTMLALNQSYRIMMVETVENKTDSDGRRILSVKGRSLEAILEDRVAKKTLSSTTTEPTWIITDDPAAVMRKIFHDICVTGTLDVGDKIPFIVEGTFLPSTTIPEPVDPITTAIEPTTVYDALVQIGQVWNLGFRMLRHFDLTQIYFDVYTGNDRTTKQTTFPAVVFTPELDNLQNTSELFTVSQAKNIAYVFGATTYHVVHPDGNDNTVAGFDRRVLVVDASDITVSDPEATVALVQRGLEELAKYRAFQAFDGEIKTNSQYKYGLDYQLGDIVEMRNTDGVTNDMRVTEQIFVSDSEGERSYPTLTLNTFINTGSWLSWMPTKIWSDLGSTEYWNTQP